MQVGLKFSSLNDNLFVKAIKVEEKSLASCITNSSFFVSKSAKHSIANVLFRPRIAEPNICALLVLSRVNECINSN